MRKKRKNVRRKKARNSLRFTSLRFMLQGCRSIHTIVSNKRLKSRGKGTSYGCEKPAMDRQVFSSDGVFADSLHDLFAEVAGLLRVCQPRRVNLGGPGSRACPRRSRKPGCCPARISPRQADFPFSTTPSMAVTNMGHLFANPGHHFSARIISLSGLDGTFGRWSHFGHWRHFQKNPARFSGRF